MLVRCFSRGNYAPASGIRQGRGELVTPGWRSHKPLVTACAVDLGFHQDGSILESCSVNDQKAEPLLLDVVAAAAIVGVGEGVIRRWVSEGLPFLRGGRGGKKLFSRRDLERFIERQKEQSGP